MQLCCIKSALIFLCEKSGSRDFIVSEVIWWRDIDSAAYFPGIKRDYSFIHSCCYCEWCIRRHHNIHTNLPSWCFSIPWYLFKGKKKTTILHFLLKNGDLSPFIHSLKDTHGFKGTHAHKYGFCYLCWSYVCVKTNLHRLLQKINVRTPLNLFFKSSLKS